MGTGDINKYVCNYIMKNDNQSYVVVGVDVEGVLVTKATSLHNNKVTSSTLPKINTQR